MNIARSSQAGKYILGLVIMIGAMYLVISSSLDTNLSFFMTPSEYAQDTTRYAGKTVHLGGMVQANTIMFCKTSLELRFVISDGTTKFPVRFTGTPPDLFKDGQGVTIEGHLENGIFRGSQLLVRHSEEYRAPKPGEKLDYANIADSSSAMLSSRVCPKDQSSGR
jgi:cytochrome c-type biogenesis protein CcmE